MSRTAACVLLIAACSSPSAPAPPPPASVVDAGVVDGITAIGSHDPMSGSHLDEGGTGRVPPRPKANRPNRPIDIMLKTSPPGAEVRVDGVLIGLTPKFWFGESDGHEHEFTFIRRGYAVGRYRFVPVQSGIIHAQLEPVAEDNPDAGIKAQIAPTFAPDASVTPDASVAPPETVLSVDAAPAPPVDVAPVTPPATPRGPQP